MGSLLYAAERNHMQSQLLPSFSNLISSMYAQGRSGHASLSPPMLSQELVGI